MWCAGPMVGSRAVAENGDGSYETFHVPRAWPMTERSDRRKPDGMGFHFDCCKTNFLPYDLCVQCCLIVLDYHLGPDLFRVNSDGTDGQWNEARDACQSVLGYGLLFRLDQ